MEESRAATPRAHTASRTAGPTRTPVLLRYRAPIGSVTPPCFMDLPQWVKSNKNAGWFMKKEKKKKGEKKTQ